MKPNLMKLTVRELLDLSRTKGADLKAIAARLKALGQGDVVLVGAEAFGEGSGLVIKTTRMSVAGVATGKTGPL